MEYPTIEKSWNKKINKVTIVYPNKYYGGVYSLGPLILYNIINKLPNFYCERQFLDNNNLKDSNLIGFSFQYEPDYYNFFKILKQNNIPLDKTKRSQLIFAGGPSININQKPLAPYIDFFLLGDIEETMIKVLKEYNNPDFLKRISKIPGVYVPGINSPSFAKANLTFENYPLYQPLPLEMDKSFVFGKCFILETERGCPYNCNFCIIPSIYKKTQFRPLPQIKKIIDEGLKLNKRNKVVIYAPSFAHPQRKEIIQYLIDKKVEFSLPSIKASIVDKGLLTLIKKGNVHSLTIAPECNESLRFKLNKKIKDEFYINFVKTAAELKFKKIKLYFLLGLPNQTIKDLDETIDFIKKLKEIKNIQLYFSFNSFVPKQTTPLENYKFDKSVITKQIKYLKKQFKDTSIKYTSPLLSLIEAKLSKLQEPLIPSS